MARAHDDRNGNSECVMARILTFLLPTNDEYPRESRARRSTRQRESAGTRPFDQAQECERPIRKCSFLPAGGPKSPRLDSGASAATPNSRFRRCGHPRSIGYWPPTLFHYAETVSITQAISDRFWGGIRVAYRDSMYSQDKRAMGEITRFFEVIAFTQGSAVQSCCIAKRPLGSTWMMNSARPLYGFTMEARAWRASHHT